ncbi:MAG: isopentenyl-diphosphate Delta-isomerase [Candidatus Methylomirabilales bacterium]
MEERVILVDADDHEIGTAEKLTAHREGRLHRAFSIFVFNTHGRLLLQKRAITKYHSGGLWTNTCCSHPRPEEPIYEAAHRRLIEEMGFDCDLREIFSFVYKVQLTDDICEHEYDHVFVGQYDGDPAPNGEELEDWQWTDVEALRKDIHAHPDRYTYWMKASIDTVLSHRDQAGPVPEDAPVSCTIVPGSRSASPHRTHIRIPDGEVR